MPQPLLDLREPDRRNTPVYVSDNATHSLNTTGPHVEVERRVEEGRATAMVRITAPDGRVLNACWVPTTNRVLSPQALIEDLISDVASKVMKKGTAAVHEVAAQRVTAAMEAGLDALCSGEGGYDAWKTMRDAALCMSDEEYDAYSAQMPIPVDRRTVAMLRDHNIPPHLARDFVLVKDPTTHHEWRAAYRLPGDYQTFGKFAAHGWTAPEYFAFRSRWQKVKNRGYYNGGNRPSDTWAVFPPPVAEVALSNGMSAPAVRRLLAEFEPRVVTLGIQAGMSLVEIRRLVSSGEWDDEAVQMLVALRAPA